MYTQYYASPRHDSFMNSIPKISGNILWELQINDSNLSGLENRLILTDGKDYFLDALSEIICFNAEGKIKWRRAKWYGSQIVLSDKLLFYQSPLRKDHMQAVDYQNTLVIDKHHINGIIDESQLVLFQPSTNSLIAQVYYPDIVDTSVPQYIVYQVLKKSLGYTWYKMYNNQICASIPLVNYEKDFVLTFSEHKGQIFVLNKASKETEPDYEFDLPEKYNALFASSNLVGDIFLTWSAGHIITLKCLDMQGKEKYSLDISDDFVEAKPVLCPPILTPEGFIYLITKNKVFCVKDKKVLWSKSLIDISYATAFADNSVIITASNKLYRFSYDGNENLNLEIDNKISAPPILDSEGRLLVCTKTKVYLVN